MDLGINISKYKYILNKLLFNIYSIYVNPIVTKRYRCKDRTNEHQQQYRMIAFYIPLSSQDSDWKELRDWTSDMLSLAL